MYVICNKRNQASHQKMLEREVYKIFKLDELLVYMKTKNIYSNIFFELMSVGELKIVTLIGF